MGTKMTHSARAELTHVVRRRYCAAGGAEKRRILDEFIAVTGYHEKSAIRVLNTEPTAKRRQIRNRPSLYDEAARCTNRAVGGLRSGLRETPACAVADSVARLGAQWAFAFG